MTDESEAERIARETPALPGDVVVFDEHYRKLVRYAVVERKEKWVGGDTYRPEHTYKVWVEMEEPELAIAKGGGCVWVMPLEEFSWSWPPPEADVYRDGRIIYPRGVPTPA